MTHDLLERLWTERGRLDGCRDIASFVMAAVRNRCYDLLRRHRADSRRDDAVAGWTECSAAAEADRWEMRELVRRALGCLPECQREVLHLKDIEGYSTREIAGMVAPPCRAHIAALGHCRGRGDRALCLCGPAAQALLLHRRRGGL